MESIPTTSWNTLVYEFNLFSHLLITTLDDQGFATDYRA